MTSTDYIEASAPLALAEDWDLMWFDRRGFTKTQAARWAATESTLPIGDWKVSAGWICEFVAPDDCEAKGDHGGDWPPSDCTCSLAEEGWWLECKRTDERAVAVWRVEVAP